MHHYQIDLTKTEPNEAVHGIETKEVLVYVLASDNGSANVQLLDKILAAANLKKSDYLLVELQNKSGNLATLLRNSNLSKHRIICFGITPAMINLNTRFTLNTPLRIGEHFLLFSDSLEEHKTNGQNKKALWNALKVIFEI